MNRTLAMTVLSLLLAAGICRAESKAETEIRRSVVRIHATQRNPNYLRPWMKDYPREVGGSGVVIDGQRILTNAHVIEYAKQIYIRPYHSREYVRATIERTSPEIDLAILKVDDANFWKNRPAIGRATQLPEIKEDATYYGYGFAEDSSLEIITSTISGISYNRNDSGDMLLRIQINARLSPGNSGGPVLVKDQMIGLAFAISLDKQVTYVIPNEEIDGFLKTASGPSRKPIIPDSLQNLQNDTLRDKLKLDKSVHGVLIRTPTSSEPSYPLRKGDILTASAATTSRTTLRSASRKTCV